MEGIAPSNAYLCGDGKSIVVAGNGDAIYKRYMDDDRAPRPRQTTRTLQIQRDRWERRDDWTPRSGVGQKPARAPRHSRELDAAGVPAGPIYTAADIVRTTRNTPPAT